MTIYNFPAIFFDILYCVMGNMVSITQGIEKEVDLTLMRKNIEKI
jgi:hypothetical protein